MERDTYRIEKVIFESRPGFPVTANLYIPTGRSLPLPAVVGTCGHSASGKAQDAYQSFAQGLARLGFICLIFDPIGQGERLQYVKSDLTLRVGVGVAEHLYAGNQQFLVGEFFGSWRAWDGIRALDYLLTRPEVDRNRVGVTGNSGGGTMTTWLCGLDQRWSMAAPSCFVTTFRRNLENELPADTEQCPPRTLALGLDHADFLAALAPKPVIILAKERDYFDARGAEEAFGRLQQLYRLLGAEQNVSLFIGPTDHGFSVENREAMYGWFQRAANVGDPVPEPELTIEKEETLWCTPRGQVADQAARSVFQFTRDKSRQLADQRGQSEEPGAATGSRRGLETAASGSSLSRIPDPSLSAVAPVSGTPGHCLRRRNRTRRFRHRVSSFRRRTVLPSAPRLTPGLAVRCSSVERRGSPRGAAGSRVDRRRTRCACFHLRCAGLVNHNRIRVDRIPFAIPTGRTTSTPSTVSCWIARTSGREPTMCCACCNGSPHTDTKKCTWRGEVGGALPAAFASLLTDQVVQVTLKHALTSYSAIAESEDYQWPLSTLLPNVLSHFDLPDCYRALERKSLRIVEPWDQTATVKT